MDLFSLRQEAVASAVLRLKTMTTAAKGLPTSQQMIEESIEESPAQPAGEDTSIGDNEVCLRAAAFLMLASTNTNSGRTRHKHYSHLSR